MPKLDEDDLPMSSNTPLPTPVMPQNSSNNVGSSYSRSYGGTSYGRQYGSQESENKFGNVGTTIQNTNLQWINNKWRPVMGWQYMATCIFDFIIAPIIWSIFQIYGTGKVEIQWQPLTLQGGGLYHIAMGAIVGITAFGRTQEKKASIDSRIGD